MLMRFGFIFACIFLLSCSSKSEPASSYIRFQSQSEIDFRETMLQLSKCQITAWVITTLETGPGVASFENKIHTIQKYYDASLASRECGLDNNDLDKLVCMSGAVADYLIKKENLFEKYYASCGVGSSQRERISVCSGKMKQFRENYIAPPFNNWSKKGGSFRDLGTKNPSADDYKIYFTKYCPF
jgi:hypothetical protein